MRVIFFIIITVLNVVQVCYSQTEQQLLTTNWTFAKAFTNKYYKAIVPGCVHTDLLNNKLIPNPYYGTNETKLQWINTTDFTYKTTVNINPTIFAKQEIELVFDGLDTYAKVYWNDSLILEANNMFRQWVIPIKHFAKQKNNTLTIQFKAAQTVTDSLAKQNLPLQIPDNNRLYARKAAYQFGWDFAPKLTTCGIWKTVKLVGWNNYKIQNLSHQLIANNEDSATIQVTANIVSNSEMTIPLGLAIDMITDKKDIEKKIKTKTLFYKNYNESYKNVENNTENNYTTITLKLEKGINKIGTLLTIPKPKYWEANGVGQQPMYCLQLYTNVLTETKTIGLRTIELVTKADSISDFDSLKTLTGKGFYFNVNNKPLYIKGANIVPLDMFPSRVTKQQYTNIIAAAKAANMNMLRVWGGGIYENEDFYNACDAAGILVWQDFMFANSMLPNDTSFLQNVQQEATYQVQRLQHHPCIALWCGNNEIDEGWHNWGWQQQYNINSTDSTKLWKNYDTIFNKILPTIVHALTPNTNYWPSSPNIGWGRQESLIQGDAHYWGVWWGLEPIETYQQKVPRYMSEYGMQSMPTIATINRYSTPKDWDTASAVMKLHQKHPTGYANLQTYMGRLFSKHIIDSAAAVLAKKQQFEHYVYKTQVLQAEAYKIAIEAHRKSKPYNMGTMLWQLNEPYPAATWSIIDYYGNKKPAYYQVQQSYNPLLIINSKLNDSIIQTTVVNDLQHTVDSIYLRINLYDYSSNNYADNYLSSDIDSIQANNKTVVETKIDSYGEEYPNNYITSYIDTTDNYNIEVAPNYVLLKKYSSKNSIEPFQPIRLVPVFEIVEDKIMVIAVKIRAQRTRQDVLRNPFLYHPTLQNITEANYTPIYIHRGWSNKIILTKPITEAQFNQLRLYTTNYEVPIIPKNTVGVKTTSSFSNNLRPMIFLKKEMPLIIKVKKK